MQIVWEMVFCVGGVVGLLLFIMAVLSPFETLGWWSGWSRRQLLTMLPIPEENDTIQAQAEATDTKQFVVYLTAIGGISAIDISNREHRFLQGLTAKLPNIVLIEDVFPFSVSNNPLNGERQFAWLWQRLHNSRRSGKKRLLTALIFIRNMMQVSVSGDPRYGPLYNVGVAQAIIDSLRQHGYVPGSGQPIIVMGWSGGGQIAVGVSRYLYEALSAPIYVISIGGVITADPGISYLEHLYHLQGSKDNFPRLGDIFYPGRWMFLTYTDWNQARKAGKISNITPGPMTHTGRKDYFDRHAKLPNGQTHLEKTVDVVADILTGLRDE